MESQLNNNLSTPSEGIAVLLADIAEAGIGYASMLATTNNVVGISVAVPIATLVNTCVRNLI